MLLHGNEHSEFGVFERLGIGVRVRQRSERFTRPYSRHLGLLQLGGPDTAFEDPHGAMIHTSRLI